MTIPATLNEQATLAARFDVLANEWKEAIAFLSSSSALVSHPAYRSIIDLGWPVVPLVLRDLEKQHAHWFEALRAITGEDPVQRKDWGNIPAMATAWLSWGRQHNLI